MKVSTIIASLTTFVSLASYAANARTIGQPVSTTTTTQRTTLRGDVSRSGRWTARDLFLLEYNLFYSGAAVPAGCQHDVNADGRIDAGDSSYLANSLYGGGSLPKPCWTPAPQSSWQIQFSVPLDTTVDAATYDVDGADTTLQDIQTLKSKGRAVICYMSAGSWEEWREDASSYPSAILGNDYLGWPGERWVDIRRLDLLGPILRKRLDKMADKGCDGVDADNVEGFIIDTGFPLTGADQLTFNRWLAREAHSRGMAIGLKNDLAQMATLSDDFDFVITESCFVFGDCATTGSFTQKGKAAFAIEYVEAGSTLDQFCTEARNLKMSAILKKQQLDSWRQACP